MWLAEAAQEPEVVHAGTTLIVGLIWMGLGAAVALLGARKPRETTQEAEPTLATRGARVPPTIGVNRVSPVIGGIWDRRLSGSTWRENAMHILQAGECHGIRGIYADGKQVVDDITPTNTPSGQSIQISTTFPDGGSVKGQLTIYWGEDNGPIINFLGDNDLDGVPRCADENGNGIYSRWPNTCLVIWQDFEMEYSPRWPTLEYELASEPKSTLTSTQSWKARTWRDEPYGLAGKFEIVWWGQSNGLHWIDIDGDVTADLEKFEALSYRVDESSPVDQTKVFVIRSVDAAQSRVYPDATYGLPSPGGPCWYVDGLGNPITTQGTVTRVYLEEFTPPWGTWQMQHSYWWPAVGAGSPRTLTAFFWPAYVETEEGTNGAHVLEQLLFAPFPQGAGLDRSDWDMASLEALGELLEEEGITTHVRPEAGKELSSTVVEVLADLGVMIPRNPNTGLQEFRAIREPEGQLPFISDDLILDPLPEVTQIFNDTKTPSSVVFTFKDRYANFEAGTINYHNDGRVFYDDFDHSSKSDMTTIRDWTSASKVAARRSQEELAAKVAVRANTSRGTRLLYPGDAFFMSGMNNVLRLMSTKLDPDTGKVEIQAAVDVFGTTEVSSAAGGRLYNKRLAPQPEVNYLEGAVQRPSHKLAFPYQAAHDKIAGCTVYISTDGTNFSYLGSVGRSTWAGVLESSISAADTQADIVTNDIGLAYTLDLSTDPGRYNNGGQFAVFGDPLTPGNFEIAYVEWIEEVSEERATLHNLLRGKESTTASVWSMQTRVYGITDQEILLTNSSVVSSAQLWFKLAPVTEAGELPLAECPIIGPMTIA